MTEALIKAMYAAPLLVAAGWDLAKFRIPNVLTLSYLALFPVAALMAPGPVDWLWHLAAFGLMFAVGLALHALRVFGGGDVKLLIVLGLWVGWSQLLELALWVSVWGGAIALVCALEISLAGQYLLSKTGLPRLLVKKEAWPTEEGEPPGKKRNLFPYGLAICLGGLAMTGKLPLLQVFR